MVERLRALEAVGLNRDFWTGRRVLVTGHTGFKGSWLSLLLERLGAHVFGLALPPHTEPSLFEAAEPWPKLDSTLGDVRDRSILRRTVDRARPELVIHMAALATVRAAYDTPAEAFSTNVMGTVNLMETLLEASAIPTAILVVTTDKVYQSREPTRPYVETDPLGGTDPYSASKVGQELVASTYRDHYFDKDRTRLATARAGNIIGGGDWSEHRLVPDYIRSVESGKPLQLRHPEAVRPWQFVLDVLGGYLLYLEALDRSDSVPTALNFAPLSGAALTVAELIAMLNSNGDSWIRDASPEWYEEPVLRLSAGNAKSDLAWEPCFNLEYAARMTAEWYAEFANGADAREITLRQIDTFLDRA